MLKTMISVSIREARTHLNDLIDKALRGEEVVLLRGSKRVVVLTPVTDADLEITPRLSDAQAERFWQRIERERTEGRLTAYDSPDEAVPALKGAKSVKKRSR